MKRNIITLSLIGFCFAASAQSQQKAAAKAEEVKQRIHARSGEEWNNNGGQHVPGIWNAYIEGDKVYIELTGEDWNSGRTFQLSELGTLPEGTEGHFTLTREAGILTFTGVFTAGKGKGFYKYAENEAFKSYLEQKGYKDLNKDFMLHIFLTDVNKGYFNYLKTNGYAEISGKQLNDLACQGFTRKVIEEYITLFKTENYGHQSIDKIIELREHGVNARFIDGFHQLGYNSIPLNQVLDLRDHGVSPGFITEFKQMGYKNITLNEAQELRDHGVNPNYINQIHQMGYKDITLERARELQDHGVNPHFIESIKALGFKDLSLEKAQELVDHGVNANFIQKAKDKGMNLHTLDDYIRLRDTGFND